MISMAVISGHWRVLWRGKIVRTFFGPDACECATGYALAMLDGRTLGRRR